MTDALIAAGPLEASVMQHTPGPWFADAPFYHAGERQKVTPIYARDPKRLDGRWLVAWCHQNAVPAKEIKPNARLIAAAPELLEALQYAVAQVPELATVPGIAAAMAKALGRAA